MSSITPVKTILGLKRSSNAPPKGAETAVISNPIAIAEETSALVQPNSASSDLIMTLGAERTPQVTSEALIVIATTTQP